MMPKSSANPLKTGTVDPQWYLEAYPDVAATEMDPAVHYEIYGRILGRLPARPGNIERELEVERENSPGIDAFDFVQGSVDNFLKERPDILADIGVSPLVSVIVTCHNSEETLEACVESLISQTWPNLEILICDDASSDSTWSIVKKLKARYRKTIKSIRFEHNVGTYIAKSQGILISSGEFVLFQDSDDYSHPLRVEIQVRDLLLNPGRAANRSRYIRFDPQNNLLLPVNGGNSKLGLITLCVRRAIFNQIGYFDSVKRAGDEEWFERLRHLKGRASCGNIDCDLYLAEYRENSLAKDLLARDGSGIGQQLSLSRQNYQRIFLDRFVSWGKAEDKFRESFRGDLSAPQSGYPAEIAAIKLKDCPRIGALCSIPSREKSLYSVVKSILPQVDRLYVFLDKYPGIPDFLKSDKIRVLRSQDFQKDHRDNAKFLQYNSLKGEFPGGFFFFTFDDDLAYPVDYVEYHVNKQNHYERSSVTGFHGVIYNTHPTSYFKDRLVFHYMKDSLSADILVNNLGTGTTCFHSSAIEAINPNSWSQGGMVDIFFSILCRSSKVPMIAISREEGWLSDQAQALETQTLFSEFLSKDSLILAELLKYVPWGYLSIEESLREKTQTLREKLLSSRPPFYNSLNFSAVKFRRHG